MWVIVPWSKVGYKERTLLSLSRLFVKPWSGLMTLLRIMMQKAKVIGVFPGLRFWQVFIWPRAGDVRSRLVVRGPRLSISAMVTPKLFCFQTPNVQFLYRFFACETFCRTFRRLWKLTFCLNFLLISVSRCRELDWRAPLLGYLAGPLSRNNLKPLILSGITFWNWMDRLLCTNLSMWATLTSPLMWTIWTKSHRMSVGLWIKLSWRSCVQEILVEHNSFVVRFVVVHGYFSFHSPVPAICAWGSLWAWIPHEARQKLD